MLSSRRHFLGLVAAAGSVGLAGWALTRDKRPLDPFSETVDSRTDNCPTFQYDSVNSGSIPDEAPLDEPPTLAWRQPLDKVGGFLLGGYPVVHDDLVIYPDAKALRAFDAATGMEQWRIPGNGSSPTVTADPYIVVSVFTEQSDGPTTYTLHAYTTEGDFVWETPTPANGIIWGGATYDPTNDALYAGTTNERVFRVDAATGTIEWTRQVAGAIKSPVAVHPHFDYVYAVAGTGGEVYALDQTGGVAWRTDLDSKVESPPTVGDGVYLLDEHGTLYALDRKSGEVRWRTALSVRNQYAGGALTGITVGAYNVYVSSSEAASNHLYAVDARDGTPAWTYSIGAWAQPSMAPVVVGDWYSDSSSPSVSIYLPVKSGVVALRPKTTLPFTRERWRWEADDIEDSYRVLPKRVIPAGGRLFVHIGLKRAGEEEKGELIALE